MHTKVKEVSHLYSPKQVGAQQGCKTDVQARKVHDSGDELINALDDRFWGLFRKEMTEDLPHLLEGSKVPPL